MFTLSLDQNSLSLSQRIHVIALLISPLSHFLANCPDVFFSRAKQFVCALLDDDKPRFFLSPCRFNFCGTGPNRK